MKYINSIFYFICFSGIMFLASCDKTEPYETTDPEEAAHFTGARNQTYSVLVDPAPVFNLEVGTTNVTSADRTISYTVTSPSGAAAGTQYNIDNSGTVLIPAGKAVGTIDIRANFSEYSTGRKDTLIIALTTPTVKIAQFQDTIILIIKGPVFGCSEDNVTLTDVIGSYPNTLEDFDGTAYGPYPTTISAVTLTSPTTGTITVTNIFDDGWGPITFELDWTDPLNRTTKVVDAVIANTDAGTVFGAAYDGIPIIVTAPFNAIAQYEFGTYSYCNRTFTLNMEIGIDGVGYYPALYQVIVAQ